MTNWNLLHAVGRSALNHFLSIPSHMPEIKKLCTWLTVNVQIQNVVGESCRY